MPLNSGDKNILQTTHLLFDRVHVSKQNLVFTRWLHVLNAGVYLIKLQQQILQRNKYDTQK